MTHKTTIDSYKKKYVLISVSDKTDIDTFAKALVKLGFEIISTGGTAKFLESKGIPVIPIEQITGNPEAFDGRMKTISFKVESALLFDRKKKHHCEQANQFEIPDIQIVVCNLYPFHTQVHPNTSLKESVELIDVGGPTMLRSASKNFENVLPVIDPKDYEEIIQRLEQSTVDLTYRKHLAAKTFAFLAWYDSQIASHLSDETFPQYTTLPGVAFQHLRYGENPHQQAVWYRNTQSNSPMNNLKKQSGRDLSLVNVTDINAGLEAVRQFTEPCAVVIKHNSPCGIALGRTAKEALTQAIEADPISAFGGIIVTNTPVDKETASVISGFKEAKRGNIDIVAMPSASPEAVDLLRSTRKTMGVYTFGEIPVERIPKINIKWIDGGFILQDSDDDIENQYNNWKVVTKKKPTDMQIQQMQLGWKFISRIRSNAIIVMDPKLPMTRGIGSGQTSRIGAVNIAIEQAGKYAKNGILVSDSFFPFGDSVTLAAGAGISAIVQQGGSINDSLSIKAADEAGIPMIMTGYRAFWH